LIASPISATIVVADRSTNTLARISGEAMQPKQCRHLVGWLMVATLFVGQKAAAQTGKETFTLKGHHEDVHSVAFSLDGKTLASAGSDGIIRLWNVAKGTDIGQADGKAISRDRLSHPFRQGPAGTSSFPYFLTLAFSPDGKTLASGAMDGTIKLWEVATPQRIVTFRGRIEEVATLESIVTFRGHTEEVRSVAFSPDGKTLASGEKMQAIKLWDIPTRRSVATLHHPEEVNTLAFSPDGKILASGGGDGTIRLWRAAMRDEIAVLRGHERCIASLAFTPDGKMLASGGQDETIRLWDVAKRRNLATLKGHTAFIASVAFSPDGRILASGGWDKTIRLWDATTVQNVATLKGHDRCVWSVAFSPDGKTLASGSADGTVKLWTIVK
jgi:WD40 repeat protein